MRIATDVLERYTDVPSERKVLRDLLDDLGLEVKRVEHCEGVLTFTIELLANRGDHHSYEGIAREITGRTGLALRTMPTTPLDVNNGAWPIERHTDLVMSYTATLLVRDGETRDLTAEQLRPLIAAGLQSVSAPVDATNLSNLELGQPTHVFDADKVDGAIVIRLSRPGETCWPLFTEGSIEVPEGTLVITDKNKILAIAGVIGCEDSKATDGSTRLLLESATFDPVAVRRASRALDIHTDSSTRFERGADPNKAVLGAGRVVHLLETAGWRREGATSRVGNWTDPRRTIALSVTQTNQFLQTELEADHIADILTRYGFVVSMNADRLDVTVPSWRLWDVAFPADLYEEIVKSVGYNETPISLPTVSLGTLTTPDEDRKRQVDEVMVSTGFYECITDGFYGRWVLDGLGVTEDHPLTHHVQTNNSLDRAYSLLKNNCLAQAVKAVADNANQRTADLKLYEWTRTFHPRDVPHGDKGRPPCTERSLLWAICSGVDQPHSWANNRRPADGLFLKGVLAELSAELGLTFILADPNPTDPLHDVLHPKRQASITLDGVRVGILGEVHPAVLKRFKIKRARPCYIEIRSSALLAGGTPPGFVEPSSSHPIERSLAFSLPRGVEAAGVASWLDACGPSGVTVTITDRFDHEVDGEPHRAITYALSFDNADQQRTAEYVNDALDHLVAAVDEEFGSRGVTQRK